MPTQSARLAILATDSNAPAIRYNPAGFNQEVTMAKRALLIGINKYQIPGADLRGCVNDVKDLSAALIEFYGFKKRDIKILLDGAATQKAMQAGITALVRGAKKGDVLV